MGPAISADSGFPGVLESAGAKPIGEGQLGSSKGDRTVLWLPLKGFLKPAEVERNLVESWPQNASPRSLKATSVFQRKLE